MASQVDAAQRILIRTRLTERVEVSLIALKASCTVRAVQRIRLERLQSEILLSSNVSCTLKQNTLNLTCADNASGYPANEDRYLPQLPRALKSGVWLLHLQSYVHVYVHLLALS
jgi:hypothetical protein